MATNKSKPTRAQVQLLVDAFLARQDEINMFRKQVVSFFEESQVFNTKPLRLIHSIKSRIKDPDHLLEKINRKWYKGMTPETLFSDINDLAGVRVIHLYTEQFQKIHEAIQGHIKKGYWVLFEQPVAYSWDPETTNYFMGLGLRAETRETYYTSIHYVVKPHSASDITCEIQVRTLFEEAWGEIDHAINYPCKTEIVACREQLRVLAKLSSTGTRLADSIFRSHSASQIEKDV